MANEITDALLEQAQEPLEVQVDSERFKGHSLNELIDADRYLAAKAAAAKNHRGLRITKLIPPGAV